MTRDEALQGLAAIRNELLVEPERLVTIEAVRECLARAAPYLEALGEVSAALACRVQAEGRSSTPRDARMVIDVFTKLQPELRRIALGVNQ